MPVSTAFDLSELSAIQYRKLALIRITWGGLTAFAILSAVANAPKLPAELAGSGSYFGLVSSVPFAVLVVTFGLVALFPWFWWISRRGPQVLNVSAEGISLGFANGKQENLSWGRPGDSVDLYDTHGVRLPGEAPGEFELFMFTSNTGGFYLIRLTPAAFGAIQESASQRLTARRVPVSQWNFGGYPLRTIHTRYAVGER